MLRKPFKYRMLLQIEQISSTIKINYVSQIQQSTMAIIIQKRFKYSRYPQPQEKCKWRIVQQCLSVNRTVKR